MLASKISCLLVVSLAFLLGALLVLPSQGQTWPDFQRKHIDSITPDLPINPDLYCDNMMRYRQMIYPLCKSHNTFLLAPVQTVQQVCQTISRQTKILSRVTFTFVFCVDTGSIHPPNCNYHGYIMSGRIRVTCENYVPIHFNGFI